MNTAGRKEINDKQNEQWTTIITPNNKLIDLKLKEVIRYRDLIFLFVKRDFITKYKQTVLGPLWYVIQPLISTIMFAFIFGNLAKISTEGLPYLLFYYGGTMFWSYFENCFKDASDTFTANAALFGKVYFPRLTVPLSRIFINMIAFFIQFCLLMCFFTYYVLIDQGVSFSFSMLFLPLIVLWLAALGIGLGLIVSAITTKYRDIKQLVTFGVGLWMYATPIVYPLSEVPESYAWLFYLNPVSAPIEFFRITFYGVGRVPSQMILSSLIFSFIAVLLGLIIFNRNERTFIDVA